MSDWGGDDVNQENRPDEINLLKYSTKGNILLDLYRRERVYSSSIMGACIRAEAI
jgi:hypothetical protein